MQRYYIKQLNLIWKIDIIVWHVKMLKPATVESAAVGADILKFRSE